MATVSTDTPDRLRPYLDQWRTYVLAQGAALTDAESAEARLREHVARLADAGLDAQETFLVALKRVGAADAPTREFARVFSRELLAETPSPGLGPSATSGSDHAPAPAAVRTPSRAASSDFWVMLGCALAAALAIKAPELFGYTLYGDDGAFYARNLSLFVLPFLAGYFIWRRGLGARGIAGVGAVFVAGAVFVNVYPFAADGSTGVLSALHLPIALWLAVGVAYSAGDWGSGARRMEYVRFTGEWLVNYALIALGGGVLMMLTTGVFEAIGLDAGQFVFEWILPCGASAAVIVAAWLVGIRRSPSGGMAPMLARIFTPLFAVLLAALLVGVIGTRGVIDMEREVLIIFDLLLVVVLALLLYTFSARDPLARPAVLDWIQIVLVVCALAVDVVALLNIVGRLAEFGFSPNRTAALGLNLILLVNLAWSAVLQGGFLRSRRGFEAVEAWQMRYVPVYALWAAIVVVSFPLLFGFA